MKVNNNKNKIRAVYCDEASEYFGRTGDVDMNEFNSKNSIINFWMDSDRPIKMLVEKEYLATDWNDYPI